MDSLYEGLIEFRKKEYQEHRGLFKELKKSQAPHTLFITCSDSRVVPSMITRSLPGELFIIRNVANMVPPYRKTEDFVSTTSAIEYAVLALNVSHIIVCGHSNCGGCAALYMPEEKLNKVPHVKKWMELAKPVREKVQSKYTHVDDDMKHWLTEHANIVTQLDHLMTYPFIEERVKKDMLTLHGWYYVIDRGLVYRFNKDDKEFELVNMDANQ